MSRPIQCQTCKTKFSIKDNKDRKKWEQDYMRCPNPDCGTLYCCLKKTEKKLRELQDIYLINHSSYVFSLMYKILFNYTKSLILKHYSSYIESKEDLIYYTDNVISLLANEYIKKDWKINLSFGGFLIYKIKQVILGIDEHPTGSYIKVKKTTNDGWSVNDVFTKNNTDITLDWKEEKKINKQIISSISMNYKLPDGNEVDFKDPKCTTEDFLKNEHLKSTSLFLSELLFEYGESYCNSHRENQIRLINIYLHISGGETKSDKYWKSFEEDRHKKVGKYSYMQSMELFRDNLILMDKQN